MTDENELVSLPHQEGRLQTAVEVPRELAEALRKVSHEGDRGLKNRKVKFQGQAELGGEAYILDSANCVAKRTAYSQRAASTDRKVVRTKLWSVKTNITHPEEQNNAICSDMDGPRDHHPE